MSEQGRKQRTLPTMADARTDQLTRVLRDLRNILATDGFEVEQRCTRTAVHAAYDRRVAARHARIVLMDLVKLRQKLADAESFMRAVGDLTPAARATDDTFFFGHAGE